MAHVIDCVEFEVADPDEAKAFSEGFVAREGSGYQTKMSVSVVYGGP